MAKTPIRPPTSREASIAGKGLATGKLTPSQVRTLAGRVESERAAAKSGKKK